MRRPSPLLAVLVLGALLPACTRPVPREAVEVRRFRVDWAAVEAPALAWEGLAIRGVVLTPAQWPLEASVKRLLAGDFRGTIEGLELGFRSSRIPEGVLEELYDAGYVPAYVRVENTADAPRRFEPLLLAVRADGETTLPAVPPRGLPGHVERVDWSTAGRVAVALALWVVVLAAAREGRGDGLLHVRGELTVPIVVEPHPVRAARERARAEARRRPPEDRGLLRAETLAPGAVREGFVLFAVEQGVADWQSAELRLNRPR